ncbi:hypothetical protein IEO21_02042 [Rhodonia placenta]|uniref:Transmembrane protein n=1 Tax=Rhodonia placenta TaxID=104341 RepID=A0A8H7P8H9_9APHY|nr:hypothetical protein IEO21_02042 [Postia placenta]
MHSPDPNQNCPNNASSGAAFLGNLTAARAKEAPPVDRVRILRSCLLNTLPRAEGKHWIRLASATGIILSHNKRQDMSDIDAPPHLMHVSREESLQKAIFNVIDFWLKRLQLVTTITTFFASMDALLFTLASTAINGGRDNTMIPTRHTANDFISASLSGALIFHTCAAVVAFSGAFVLCRYELVTAEHAADDDAAGAESSESGLHAWHRPAGSDSSTSKNGRPTTPELESYGSDPSPRHAARTMLRRVVVRVVHPLRFCTSSSPREALSLLKCLTTGSDAAIQEMLHLPVDFLERCLRLSLMMTGAGFILGILGILSYAWVALPRSVSVFASACVGSCFLVSIFVIV